MLIDSTLDVELPAAFALTRGVPRDQALGLRLMMLARTAAGMHLGQAALGDLGAETKHTAQERAENPQLLRSQASGLIARFPESAR